MKILPALLLALLLRGQQLVARADDCIPLKERFAEPLNEDTLGGELIGDFNSTASLDIWYNNPLSVGSPNGTLVGVSNGNCHLLPGALAWLCVSEITFADTGDSITITGLSPNSEEPGTQAITGGTGCYDGASGTVTLTAQSIVTEYDSYKWELVSTQSTSKCTSLEERFNGGSLFENNSGSENIGGYETVGAHDLWFDNSVMAGSIDGDQIASSYGVCVLLSGVESFECVGSIFFSDTGDMIAYAGDSPNSFEPGSIVVTGGTGCYEGAVGHLSLTAMEVNEPYDFYEWNFVDDSMVDSCMTLEDVFDGIGGVLIEENTSDGLVGGGNATGDLDLWHKNSLKKGSIDGEDVGYTMGSCILLPTASDWLCTAQLVISGVGTISLDGLSPNAVDIPGNLAITGGTGCFEGVDGTVAMTPLQIVELYDAYEWALVSATDSGSSPSMSPVSAFLTTVTVTSMILSLAVMI